MDFALPQDDSPDSGSAGCCARWFSGDRRITVPISGVIDRADEMLAQIQDGSLRTVVTEAFAAFDNPHRGRAAIHRLGDTVPRRGPTKNNDAIVRLIDSARPVLASPGQHRTEIASWTRDLTTVTDQLRQWAELTGILDKAPRPPTKRQAAVRVAQADAAAAHRQSVGDRQNNLRCTTPASTRSS